MKGCREYYAYSAQMCTCGGSTSELVHERTWFVVHMLYNLGMLQVRSNKKVHGSHSKHPRACVGLHNSIIDTLPAS